MLAIEPQWPKIKRGNYRLYSQVKMRPVGYRSLPERIPNAQYQAMLRKEYGHYYFMMKIWNRAAGREECGISTPRTKFTYEKLDPLKRESKPWRRRANRS